MIVVRVQLQVKPENREAFIGAFTRHAEKSRQFAGCEAFNMLEDVQNGNTYSLYEEWASAEAFDAFRNSEELKASGSTLFPFIDGKPTSSYYEAARIN
jgi:quinol monooxygenase YgiN